MPKWQHRLLLDLACNPSADAEAIAAATGYKLSTCKTYLCTLTRAGLIAAVHRADEVGPLPTSYYLTEAGGRLFEDIVTADASLRKLRLAQRARRRGLLRLA